MNEDSRWQDVFDTFTSSEQTCIRSAVDDEQLARLLNMPVFAEDVFDKEVVAVFECLETETASDIFAGMVLASPDAEEARLGPSYEACVRGLVSGLDVVALSATLVAAGQPDADPDSIEEADGLLTAFLFGLLGCLPEDGAADGLAADDRPSAPYVSSPGPHPRQELILWGFRTGEAGQVVVSPTVANGMVYAGSQGNQVYALDAGTGELVWSFETASSSEPPPAVSEDVVRVTDRDTHYWLDALTGELLWSDASIGGSVHEPQASQGTVYAVTAGESERGLAVLARDARSGRQRWRADIRLEGLAPLLFPLTAAGSSVYLSDDSTVHALDAATGETIWSFKADGPVVAPPTVSEGTVYMRSYDTAYALDEATSETRWSLPAGTPALNENPPTVVSGIWYLVTDTLLWAVDATTGESLWSAAVDAGAQPPQPADGTVYITSLFGDLHAIDAATGEILWISALGGATQAAGGVVYSHTVDGDLHAIDAATGEAIWSLDIGYHWWKRPFAVADGSVYVADVEAEAHILALKADSP